MNAADLVESRRAYSESRLREVGRRLEAMPSASLLPGLCIYVTGSFGRGEAHEHSDLDLFFLSEGKSSEPFSRLSKTQVDADIIRVCQELSFPAFSNDGEYLEAHYLEDIKESLGSSKDDYHNHFTARLLLLLESRPLLNSAAYDHAMEDLIRTYYRDYPDHAADFRPVFLANDILRFWKTLCLNYEHKRQEAHGRASRPKANLKNLQLKYSRMVTCFSTVMLLGKNHGVIRPEELAALVKQPPLTRLEQASSSSEAAKDLYRAAIDEYAWFLEVTGKPKKDVIAWISEHNNKKDALAHAHRFGGIMFGLLMKITEGSEVLRYIVI